MFRSLRIFNYRLWFAGALVSNTGSWMQRTAQDWIVLTELTDHDAAALGITMALQFGPVLLLMPISGLIADRFDRRRVLMWTQAAQCGLALGMGVLVIAGHAQLWHLYAFALLLGVTTAIDAPVRQAFVSELVTDADLSNAVALNSTSFQSARLIGPALAGVLIAWIGSGPLFIINGVSFAGVLLSLVFIRRHQLVATPKLSKAKGQIRDGLSYVIGRKDILVVLVMVSLVGTFGFNFPIFISTMSTVEFSLGATEFGFLSSIMAVGAVVGSLLAARRERARLGVVIIAAAAFGMLCILAAVAPSYGLFAVVLIFVGASSLTMMNTANAYVQTTTAPMMRGRVMALYMAIFVGGTPIGAPIVGWVANEFGPRWSLGIGAASGILAAAIAGVWMLRSHRHRMAEESVATDPVETRELATQEIAIVAATARRTS
ncbi:MFS transporter [Salinibacterium sp. G-O1]|uniref:MFS transporter n=1 Tax=Salinibacterium sp. G-O1 TaxID=3046208 RepID=UPI0024BA484D|nr:MFS transporter [Salinibacterium sp. G-O1]MDJ0336265.1 MFS transporter [Salinibacterium sp. G-O1]